MSLKPKVLKEYFAEGIVPRDLGNGLVLRYATAADAEPLAQFNGRIHGRDHFDEGTAQWTRDFCSDAHPTCGPSNVSIVEEAHTGNIVSSMCLIPQTWTYQGIPIDVGRMEAVGTDPAYRRRGLIREQFDLLHSKSASMGHLLQAITGIPWYYRQFGYEYALDLGGGRVVPFQFIVPLKPEESEPYSLRPMTPEDLPLVRMLYEREIARAMVACPRPDWLWEHLLFGYKAPSFENREFQIIEAQDGRAVGYVVPMREVGNDFYGISELAVKPEQSLRAVMPSVLRGLKQFAEPRAQEQKKTPNSLFFQLGRAHPLYDAIPEKFSTTRPPYGWYIRVPDLAALLRGIAPVLEDRLAKSTMAGHSGELRINEYTSYLQIAFQDGKIRDVQEFPGTGETEWPPAFPPRTFLQLVFGFRSLDELRTMYPDCWALGDAVVLLNALFPKQPSFVIPVG